METSRFPGDSKGPSSRPRFDDSIGQLIRSAERFMSQRKFAFAREQLGVAHTLDPKNTYIDAILERLSVLELQGSAPSPAASPRNDSGAPDARRYLAVSVGSEFSGGIREQEPVLPSAEIQSRVRQLTTMAERLLERGSPENAFDTLMKAYLLDPVSPYVLSCERSVLPAWQSVHHLTSAVDSHPSSSKGDTVNISHTPSPQDLAKQEKRLEALKLRKELERQEHERASWREASSPPTVFGIADAAHRQEHGTDLAVQDEDRSLFSKLKRGKFLNR